MAERTCVFFGHRNTPDTVRPLLRQTLTALIEQRGVHRFFVGNQGNFDAMVRKELKELARLYPAVRYSVVLAYMPGETDPADGEDYSDTVYPEGLEEVPLRFAVEKRNRMMLEWANIVVTYVRGPGGGAAKFKELAEKKKKEVINLFDLLKK